MQTFSTADLGNNREKTPEGFLLCHGVRMARTGELQYGRGQTPVQPGPDGVARVTRDDAVLFDAETLASFVGKSITFRHKVSTGANWREVEAGTILNARRGSAPYQDFMVGDWMIKDQEVVSMLDRGERLEVSNGYTADYEDLGGGYGRQKRIRGNHSAMLPPGTRGRCGTECYVGDTAETECYVADQAMDIEETKMTTKSPLSAVLAKLLGAKTEDEQTAIVHQITVDEAVNTAVEVAIKPLTDKVAQLTNDNADLTAKLADASKAQTITLDAATVTASHGRVVAAAEILAPGTQVATFDAADLAASTESIIAAQRTALTAASTNPKTKPYIDALLGGADVGTMTADQLGANFYAAAGMVGIANNNVLAGALLASLGEGAGANAVKTNIERSADADKASKEKWAAIRAARNAH